MYATSRISLGSMVPIFLLLLSLVVGFSNAALGNSPAWDLKPIEKSLVSGKLEDAYGKLLPMVKRGAPQAQFYLGQLLSFPFFERFHEDGSLKHLRAASDNGLREATIVWSEAVLSKLNPNALGVSDAAVVRVIQQRAEPIAKVGDRRAAQIWIKTVLLLLKLPVTREFSDSLKQQLVDLATQRPLAGTRYIFGKIAQKLKMNETVNGKSHVETLFMLDAQQGIASAQLELARLKFKEFLRTHRTPSVQSALRWSYLAYRQGLAQAKPLYEKARKLRNPRFDGLFWRLIEGWYEKPDKNLNRKYFESVAWCRSHRQEILRTDAHLCHRFSVVDDDACRFDLIDASPDYDYRKSKFYDMCRTYRLGERRVDDTK